MKKSEFDTLYDKILEYQKMYSPDYQHIDSGEIRKKIQKSRLTHKYTYDEIIRKLKSKYESLLFLDDFNKKSKELRDKMEKFLSELGN